jgi:hypothetical protein
MQCRQIRHTWRRLLQGVARLVQRQRRVMLKRVAVPLRPERVLLIVWPAHYNRKATAASSPRAM